jgi:hypothetical protein
MDSTPTLEAQVVTKPRWAKTKRFAKGSLKLWLYTSAALFVLSLVAMLIGFVCFELADHTSLPLMQAGEIQDVKFSEAMQQGGWMATAAVLMLPMVLGLASMAVVATLILAVVAVVGSLALGLGGTALAFLLTALLLAVPFLIFAAPMYWFYKRATKPVVT